MPERYVYPFGDGKSDGDKTMKQLLGGKGANLCEMTKLGLPVPPGFVITTECCDFYNKHSGKYPDEVQDQVAVAIDEIEKQMGVRFGNASKPLLLSVRSGAAVSMPGMMDTVLNLGLNDVVVAAFATEINNEAFVWDSYRRFIAMYANVVGGCDMEPFEHELWGTKKRLGIQADCDIPVRELKRICGAFKKLYEGQVKKTFPQDPKTQLWESITAVFRSWNNARAVKYRSLNRITGLKGTAVNVQAMVYGNYNNESATGVCFSRNPSDGDPRFYGEWLVNAQGEDVVAGIRTPQQITKEASVEWARNHGIPERKRATEFPSMEERMPRCYKELVDLKDLLERHYKDMQDMEFTIQNGKLFFLQTRSGKRTMQAAVRIAKDMVNEGLIDKKEAIMRLDCGSIDQLLHPYIDPKQKVKQLAKGLPASPGAGVGQIVFTAQAAEEWKAAGKSVIMVRVETSPEDLTGMDAAVGILTARGGMTSHAAVVARGMGKCCVCGVNELVVDYKAKTATLGAKTLREGDWISLNGSSGQVIDGKVPLVKPSLSGPFGDLLKWATEVRRLGVRANADTPKDAKVAFDFGAEGIGLCRTEHMFFEGNRIDAVREMILAETVQGRKNALEKILPYQEQDFKGIFKAMNGLPCTIRLLDPPLHEFVPHDDKAQTYLAQKLGLTKEYVHDRVHSLTEANPMLGHRGVRLGLSYPEIYDTQVEAVFRAACDVKKETGLEIKPEVMIPLVGKVEELAIMKRRAIAVAEKVMEKKGVKLNYLIGTMIEVPRACVTADQIAVEAEFFSFGTNDLTQMGCGFSRDDSGKFLKEYVQMGIYTHDPFQVLDQEGVGALMEMAVKKGRATRGDLKCGICGEHGGEPSSVKFCHRTGLNYVSCSPYRVPVAIIAAAQAAIEEERALAAARAAIARSSKL
ncbi:Pyruvate [Diplonema papillatum]|nr:Pyruvate [Diplonema papillatum]|eukprot:gene795-1222_t